MRRLAAVACAAWHRLRARWQMARGVPVPRDGEPLDRDEARVLRRTGRFIGDKSEVRRAALAEVRHWERLVEGNR